MRQFAAILLVSALGILLLTGCQESNASQIRRARIIANENLELKEDLEDKDQQIAELKEQIEKIGADSAKKVEQAGETSIKSMRLLLESERSKEALILENQKLKEELEKLKRQ